jgi:hypothetical protein
MGVVMETCIKYLGGLNRITGTEITIERGGSPRAIGFYEPGVPAYWA